VTDSCLTADPRGFNSSLQLIPINYRTDAAPLALSLATASSPLHIAAQRTAPRETALRTESNAHFTPPAKHDKTVLSVSCLVCRCELDYYCSERVQISNFLSEIVLSCRESNSHRNTENPSTSVDPRPSDHSMTLAAYCCALAHAADIDR